jgi:hypothetical protein
VDENRDRHPRAQFHRFATLARSRTVTNQRHSSRALGIVYRAISGQLIRKVVALENAYRDTGHRLPPAADLAGALSLHGGRPKSLLKFLDEYYYARATPRPGFDASRGSLRLLTPALRGRFGRLYPLWTLD